MKPRGSLISQLLIALSVFAVLIGLAGAAGYIGVSDQDSAARQLTDHYQVLQKAENNLQGGFAVAQSTLLLFSVTGQHSYLLPVSLSKTEFRANMAQLRHSATPDLKSLIATQAQDGNAWFALAPRIGSVTPRSQTARTLLGTSFNLALGFDTAANATQQRLQQDIAGLSASSTHALNRGLVWGGFGLAVALLLVLLTSLSTLRSITGPLRRLTATVGRLTAGDHAARATEYGSAEVREVARSVNTLADESDRLRALEGERNRLLVMAREAGLRIREHLVADDLLNEARIALEDNIDADVVYLRLLENGRLGPLVGHEPGWLLPVEAIRSMSPDALDEHHGLFRAHASKIIQDVRGAEGDLMPPDVRDAYRAAGVVSHLMTPFGVGNDVLGVIVANRMRSDRPWRESEVAAVESIAVDLGRGLHHARLYEAENRVVEELRAVDQTKSDFLATVSHELRTPLTSIGGYMEILRDRYAGPLTPAQEKVLDKVDRNTVRLRSLIEDVLTLSKIESGTFKTTMQPVNIEEIIAPAMSALMPAAAAKGLNLATDAKEQRLVVRGDPGQLDRVLVNLLSNAVKFTPEGGSVKVSVGSEGAMAVLSVADTGMGIPDADQKELFTRFFRASNAVKRAIPGTGLGLAIVRTIVANHGGDMTVWSKEGKGTTVSIRIPLLGTRRKKPRATATAAASSSIIG